MKTISLVLCVSAFIACRDCKTCITKTEVIAAPSNYPIVWERSVTTYCGSDLREAEKSDTIYHTIFIDTAIIKTKTSIGCR